MNIWEPYEYFRALGRVSVRGRIYVEKPKICFRLCCQAAPAKSITRVRYNQMSDAHKEEEQVQLLGEDALRQSANAQNLKLG